jgi:hypothetical protein
MGKRGAIFSGCRPRPWQPEFNSGAAWKINIIVRPHNSIEYQLPNPEAAAIPVPPLISAIISTSTAQLDL